MIGFSLSCVCYYVGDSNNKTNSYDVKLHYNQIKNNKSNYSNYYVIKLE